MLVQDKLKPTVIYGVAFGITGTCCATIGTVLGIIGLYDMYDLNRTLTDVTSGKLTPPGTLVAGLTLLGMSLAFVAAAIAIGIFALGLLKKKEGPEKAH